MPEMPEVETIKRTLQDKLIGKKIAGADINLPRLIKWPSPFEFKAMLFERTIANLERRGKYLIFHLDNNLTLVIHLRMTGRLYYQQQNEDLDKHTHIVLRFSDGDALLYADSRTFGALYLMPFEELWRISGLSLLGPEPLSPEFTPDYFQQNIISRKGKIKSLLLNQNLIGGLGNIYVDESLSIAGIDPERAACSLSGEEGQNLFDAINKVISEAIEHGGTTFRDYRDGDGNKGNHQNYLYVYGRSNQSCHKCGGFIAQKKVAGRTSSYCPNCQK